MLSAGRLIFIQSRALGKQYNSTVQSHGWRGARLITQASAIPTDTSSSSSSSSSSSPGAPAGSAAASGAAPAAPRGRPHKGARQKGSVLVDLSVSQSRDEPPVQLAPGILGNRFWLPADEVQRLLAEHSLSEDQLLQLLITPASQLARPPISSYRVGAVGLGASGALYVGVNLEFVHLPLYNSVHAEQFLVVNALHHGERDIRKLAVSAAPCGHCRQFYSELACAETIRISFGGGTYSLGNLLPNRFKPADLLEDPSTPLLLQPQDNAIALGPGARAALEGRAGDAAFQRAAEEALAEAVRSYAPYSKCPAGAAVITAEGEVYSGPYLESAAYNPSLPPLQTAIIDAVIDGMPCFSQVREVVLVELAGAHVQHAPSVRVVLEQIAPGAQLTVLHTERLD